MTRRYNCELEMIRKLQKSIGKISCKALIITQHSAINNNSWALSLSAKKILSKRIKKEQPTELDDIKLLIKILMKLGKLDDTNSFNQGLRKTKKFSRIKAKKIGKNVISKINKFAWYGGHKFKFK